MTPECKHCEGLGCFNATFTDPGQRCEACKGTGLAPAPTGVSPAVVKEFVEVLQKYLRSACTCDEGYGCSACDCGMDLSGILEKIGEA